MSGTAASIISFFILGLALITLSHEIKQRFKASPAISLSVIGLLIGLVAHITFNYDIRVVECIDSDFVILGILPALIFEVAFMTNWFALRNVILRSLFLATIVTFMCALINALAIYYTLNIEFNLRDSLLIGVILSATDHVAAVSQLKNLQVEASMKNIIIGESLLNEVALFVMYKEIDTNHEYKLDQALDAILHFGLSALGGVLLGLIASFIGGILLRHMKKNEKQDIAFSVMMTYAIFLIGHQTDFHISGAIGVLVWGLYMSVYGKTHLTPESEKIFHSTWELIAQNIEGIALLLGGIIFGNDLKRYFDENPWMIVYAGLIFLYTIVSRVIVVFLAWVCCCIFKCSSSKRSFDSKQWLVLMVSASKGTIQVVLAIDSHKESGDDILFVVIFNVLASILVGHFAMKILTSKFQMTDDAKQNEVTMLKEIQYMYTEFNARYEQLLGKYKCDFIHLERICSAAGYRAFLLQLMKKSYVLREFVKKNPLAMDTEILSEIGKMHDELESTAKEKLIKIKCYKALSGFYTKRYRRGACFRETFIILNGINTDCMFDNSDNINDWESVKKQLKNSLIDI